MDVNVSRSSREPCVRRRAGRGQVKPERGVAARRTQTSSRPYYGTGIPAIQGFSRKMKQMERDSVCFMRKCLNYNPIPYHSRDGCLSASCRPRSYDSRDKLLTLMPMSTLHSQVCITHHSLCRPILLSFARANRSVRIFTKCSRKAASWTRCPLILSQIRRSGK